MAFHSFGQAANAFADILGSGVGKIQAHVAAAFEGIAVVYVVVMNVARLGIEGVAGHESYILLERGDEDGFHVQTFGQSNPEK